MTADTESAAAPVERPPRASARLLIGLGGFVLAVGLAAYAWVGTPGAWQVGPGSTAPGSQPPHEMADAQFSAMADQLAERLRQQPDDAEGWAMLARSYTVLGRHDEALPAFRRLLALRPQDAQAHADLADALGAAQGRSLEGEPERLVERALQLEPDNVKALALAGTIALQRGDAATAQRHWERALGQVEPGSEIAARLQGAVDDARQRAAGGGAVVDSAGKAADQKAPDQKSADAGAVQGRVTLAPALAAQARPEDTVYVFARAAQGPAMPLAILRKQVKDLPLDFRLDDDTAMSPATRLSKAAQVVVVARISRSGNAMPQPGDLQGQSAPVAPGATGVQVQIGEPLR